MMAVFASSFVFIVTGDRRVYLRQERQRAFACDPVSFTNGAVSIPLSQVSDGDLHRYEAQ